MFCYRFHEGNDNKMFDIKATGKRLAEFRRNNNLTQREVAEKLGISFQAVSDWERGKTMPDIAKLVEISKIYNVSIDEILNDEIQSLSVKKISKFDESSDSLQDHIRKKNKEIIKNMQKTNIRNFKQLLNAAPYLKNDVLSNLVIQNSKLIDSFSKVCKIASYITQDTLDKIALENSSKVETFEQLLEVSCRMSKPNISRLISDHIELYVTFSQICDIASFIDKEVLCVLVDKNISKIESYSQIYSIASYVDKNTISKVVYMHSKKFEDFNQISTLAFCLSPESLAKVVFDNIEKPMSKDQFNNIFYYLNVVDKERIRHEKLNIY